MPITTAMTANSILNRVAVEVGLEPVSSPYESQDPNFVQLTYLLNIAGEELAIMYPWNFLTQETSINTTDDDSGDYSLPSDYLYMTNQTCWERNNRVPVVMLSAQDWAYLEGRQFASDTIYVKFRLQQGKFTLYPQPAPSGLEIFYEYTSKNWGLDGSDLVTRISDITRGADVVLYDRTLITRYLKCKWLEAKGFDSSKAQDDVNQIFNLLTGHDKDAPLLSAGNGSRGFPFLDVYRNVGDSNFGHS